MEQVSQNPFLNHLIDLGFQGVNRIFELSFESTTATIVRTGCYLPKAELKVYIVMTDGKNFFGQTIKDDIKIYKSIRKIAIGQGSDYRTGFLIDYPYFKENYKMIVVDSKHLMLIQKQYNKLILRQIYVDQDRQ